MAVLRRSSVVSLFFGIVSFAAGAALAQTGNVNTSGTGTSGVYIESTSGAFPDVGVEVIDSLRVFNSANAELLRVHADGKVGIGITAPADRFHILDNADRNSIFVMENPNPGLSAIAAFRAKSDVAFGSWNAHASVRTLVRFNQVLGGWMELLSVAGNGLAIGTLNATPLIIGTGNADRIHITPSGDVGINKTAPAARLHVGGNMVVDGDITGAKVINAVYQDLAEWVSSDEPLGAGTVVIVAPGKKDQVAASSMAYDTRVAGVVSEKPGLLLGVPGDAKVKVATTGRVRVRVDAGAAPIEAGDILVTSARPGVAMKSIPIELAGAKLHRPGTVIGKALEPLLSGEGEILVLLSLQ